jgi:type IV pilus assembly protein PilW
MVSMVIGLLIVLALITLLINVNRNNSEMTKTNRVIENGRFALQLLEADISHAGYWGGFVPAFDDLTTTGPPADVPTAVPDPCLAFASWGVPPYTDTTAVPPVSHKSNLIGIAVQGYEIPTVVPSPTLSVCASKVTNPKANTDVLFVRHVETCVPGVGTCAALNPGDLYFQVARCGDTLPSPAYAWNPYALASVATDFPSKNKYTVAQANCTNASSAELRKFVSNLYYIRNYAVTVGDGIPTLMRSQFGLSGGSLQHESADAMIEGIEGFRVEFGIDNVSDSGAAVNFGNEIAWADTSNLTSPTNRGDGIPDGSFVHCTTATPCTAAQLMNATVVKLYVLVRSENTTPGYTDTKTYAMGSTSLGPFNDGYKRHLFTQTIRLTNISSRRETP